MDTFQTQHLTINQLSDALLAAPPGAAIIYATGDLNTDRYRSRERKNANEAELVGVDNFAWESYLNGRVLLTQRKLASSRYQYIATKRLPATAKKSVS
jgi:hypothetical protein